MKKRNMVVLILVVLLLLTACDSETDKVVLTDDESKLSIYMERVDEEKEKNTGKYSTEEFIEKHNPIFGVRYSDGTLDELYNGDVISWGKAQRMDYGIDYLNYRDLIIRIHNDNANPSINEDNQLVMYYSGKSDVIFNIYAVEASGCTISRYRDDGRYEAVFFGNREDGTVYCKDVWLNREDIYSAEKLGFECDYINGIPIEEFSGLAVAEGTQYVDVPQMEKYTLGVIDGTSIVETEYWADRIYYLQSDEEYQVNITPTADGYAIVDTTNIPAGEYILQLSFWEEKSGRHIMTTHITIE